MYKWIQTSLNQHVKFKKYDRKEFQGNECIWYQTQLLCPRVIIFNNHTPTIFRQGELNFKDQDYQHSSPSENVFFLPSPPPSNLHRTFFFPHISHKYHNNRSSCGSDHSTPPPPPTPLLKEQTTIGTLHYLPSVVLKSLGSWIFTLNFLLFRKSSHLGDKIHTGFKKLIIWGAKSTGPPHSVCV